MRGDFWTQRGGESLNVLALDNCDSMDVQFPDVVTFSEEMANRGKVVIVAALDGTFQRKPFGRICDLIPLAESVVKLTAVCQICQASAAFTKRLGDEKQIELIGGADKYIAVCRHCYHSAMQAFPTP